MDGYDQTRKLLQDHLDILHRLAAELLEKEVLNAVEIDGLLTEYGVSLPESGQPAS